MALFPSHSRKGLGLKFEESPSATYGVDRMGLELHSIPRRFMAHEADIPIVDGRRLVLDQQATSSCVLHAYIHGILLKERREGLPFDLPSVLFPYWHSRKEHGSQWFDGGTFLYTGAAALRHFGSPSEVYWKWSPMSARVNRRPSYTAYRHARPRRGGRYVRIYETGEARIAAMQQAMLNGNDIAIGTRLGKSFLPAQGPTVIDVPLPTEEIAGNHAMLVIGWDYIDGELYFRVLNSWGPHWRDGGLCWMSARYMMASFTRDIHIIYGWSRLNPRRDVP